MSVEEQLAGVEFHNDAGHRPDVALLIPAVVLENHFGRAVLPGIDNQGMGITRVRRTAEVDHFNLARYRLEPFPSRSRRLALLQPIRGVIS